MVYLRDKSDKQRIILLFAHSIIHSLYLYQENPVTLVYENQGIIIDQFQAI